LEEIVGKPSEASHLHQFLAHFVLIVLDFMHAGATDLPQATTLIRDSLTPSAAEKAPLIWSRLVDLARTSAGRAGEFDRARLVQSLLPVAGLRNPASLVGNEVRWGLLVSMREHCEQLPQALDDLDAVARLSEVYTPLSLRRTNGNTSSPIFFGHEA